MKPQPSSLYLAGNKLKIVEDIVPHLVEEGRNILVEPFVGTGVMSLHCLEKGLFEKSYCNDLADWLVGLHNSLRDPKFILDVSKINGMYKDTEEDFLKLRENYNSGGCKNDAELFVLMLRGNSNRVRFSGRGKSLKHNIPYGKRNPFNMERMLRHHTLCQDMEVSQGNYVMFLNKLSKELDWSKVVIYADPPYFGTMATYNTGWTSSDDAIFRETMLKYKQLGAKVVFSNIFSNKKFVATELIDWCKANEDHFEVHHLDMDYSNTDAHKWLGDKTDEVLVVSK
ncbi:D12 class N6 adenine-specific DNA methyltransferase [Vibrio phage 1.121.O._10N.286.46.C4]|nr:D12 class N6 adenine-specific DNA methyltransferase [Vibrio phage 1.121.O._10N.286.46.C4]